MAFMYRVRAASNGWPGAPGLNTFYFEADDATGTEAAANLCVTRVRDAFIPILPGQPTSWTLQVSPVVDVIQDTDGELQNSIVLSGTPAALVGTAENLYAPTSVMLLLKARTNTFHDGSRIAGRSYIGPSGPHSDPNGSPVAGALARVVTMGEELQDLGLLGGPRWVVWRRPRAARTLPTPLAARAGTSARVVSFEVPDKFAVLRSRRD